MNLTDFNKFRQGGGSGNGYGEKGNVCNYLIKIVLYAFSLFPRRTHDPSNALAGSAWRIPQKSTPCRVKPGRRSALIS